jgi:cytochrome c556
MRHFEFERSPAIENQPRSNPRGRIMNTSKMTLVTSALFGLAALPGIVHADDTPTPSGNPLVQEMRTLDQAMCGIVSAVALGDGARVRAALEPLHSAREKTEQALESGAIKLPKNPQRLAEFAKRDTAFHADLERLAAAAGRNDQLQMLTVTKKLLDGCVACHQTFRR